MSSHRKEARLLALLHSSSDLDRLGVSFLPGLHSGIVIHSNGRACGVWHAEGEGYHWTPACGDTKSYLAASPEDAVEFMVRSLSPH